METEFDSENDKKDKINIIKNFTNSLTVCDKRICTNTNEDGVDNDEYLEK